ncbi:MAG: glyoxalase/bleomycin resistance/extradiol dioxygenase family protein [Archangium gephyra]|uniref:Glyoxalase/bleomycin resistance/extradiol dioxygenase family protein n=1 Tax=Archangium gephyra TaxID=48 RepID=A0A2W5TQV7_9BACT|nr:MAG: glyoxalase/bleomycin resistance/extradiol dioxygenase family protein [Archangium gephyra]
MKAQPLICVKDVEASSRWYCELLGARSGHGGKEYERVTVGDEFVLQLHPWDAHGHENLGDANEPVGNGLLLWFQVDDVEAAAQRARSLRAKFVEALHLNTSANHHEFWVEDPDGYVVVLAGPPLS